jgi:nicotinamidase-related amidase
VRDCLLLIDVLSDFSHDDGGRLAEAFADSLPALEALLGSARDAGVPVVYANDHFGDWTADRQSLVERGRRGPLGDRIGAIAPGPGEPLLIKPRYSAFDHTALELVPDEIGAERLILAGSALEMCVAQSAIAARELGYKVTVALDACPEVDAANAHIAATYLERVAGARLERRVAL